MKNLSFLTLLVIILVSCTPALTPAPISMATETPGPTPTSTPRQEATATVAPTVTPDIVTTIMAISEPRIYSSLLSPNGEWRAEIVSYPCIAAGGMGENAYEQLKLIQVDNGVEQIADNQLWHCGGLGVFGLEGLFWSLNSRYFYYTNAREGFPGGCGYWERPIIRLDVSNLEGEYLGAEPISPDGTMMIWWEGQELVVWDFNEGEIARVSAIVAKIGPVAIAWSPDSQALIYAQPESYCPLSGNSYVVRLDLSTLEQTLLLESETPTFGYVSWNEQNELMLFDENEKKWSYNFTTQELREAP